MAKLLAALGETPLAESAVYDDDATQLLDWLPEASLDRLDLLYPDPWPKKKHWKRRFVAGQSRPLRPRAATGRQFCFASDIDTYVNWTLFACRDHARLRMASAGRRRLRIAL